VYINKNINYLFWFVLAFPFIPSFVHGTDTQPTFIVIFFILIILSFFFPDKITIKLRNKSSFFLTIFLIVGLYLSIFYNVVYVNKNLYFPRIFAFFQFLSAFVFGASTLFYLPKRWLHDVLLIYAIFTLIFFFSGGMVEDFLIKSRMEGTSNLLVQTGRGARTLSPEPSILAIHILNLILLNFLVSDNDKMNLKTFMIALIPLLGSFSGYGFFISLILVFIFYPKFFLVISGLVFFLLTVFLVNLENLGIRMVLIFNGLRVNGIEFLLKDKSFSTRLNSFLEYKNSFINTFPFGDSFSIFGGGGIISIISGLGVFGLVFFIIILTLLVLSKYSKLVKFLFFIWFLIFFISGSFGVPLFGLILGVFVTNSLRHEKNLNSAGGL
jgi:hypothetical protein